MEGRSGQNRVVGKLSSSGKFGLQNLGSQLCHWRGCSSSSASYRAPPTRQTSPHSPLLCRRTARCSKAVKSGKIGKLERELLHASSSADLNEAVTEAAKLRHADMVLALLRSGASVHGEHTDAQPAGTTKLLAKNEKDKALFKKVGGLDRTKARSLPRRRVRNQNRSLHAPRAHKAPPAHPRLHPGVAVARAGGWGLSTVSLRGSRRPSSS